MLRARVTGPFDHPWLSGLFGDPDTRECLSAEAQLEAMLRVEAAYSRALGQEGIVGPEVAERAALAIEAFEPSLEDLREGSETDGVPVPALIRALKQRLDSELHVAVHAGLTSQDVVDTAFAITLRPVLDLFEQRLRSLKTSLEALETSQGARALTGRTRMQAALPITVADRIATWRLPMVSHLGRLDDLRPRVLILHFGGPVGTRGELGVHGDAVAETFARILGLGSPPKAPHAMRDGFADLAHWLSLVSGSLGKMGQDVVLMAQQGIDEVAIRGGGSSSAMPHKSNPVLAETLVTLARFNATLVSGMHHALVHEQERSGAAWALEWMLLPQMIEATGRSLSAAQHLCASIDRIGFDS